MSNAKNFDIIYLKLKEAIIIKLDYTISSPEERNELVKKIIQEAEDNNTTLSERYLEILGNYLVFSMEKEERKQKHILTENRMSTVNKRETSFEGLVSQFENGEDGVYNLIKEDKNQIFRHKIEINEKDLEEIPFLKQIKEAIADQEKALRKATGKAAYIIKQGIIELSKDQYIIKDAYRKPIVTAHMYHSPNYIALEWEEWVEDGEIRYKGISFMDYKVCSAILCNYSKLKAAGEGNFMSDTWYMMESFDKLCERALKDYPYYDRLVEYKIDGKQNAEIQDLLQVEFGIRHTPEYLSSLWRNKIPKLLANSAQEHFLDWWYLNVEKGTYKKCSRCGQIKLANNRYFSRNKTSKDGFYSLCKECRNKKS